MTGKFQKFPHTQHLVWLGKGAPRSDKIMSAADVERFLSAEILVEEKIDGANLGLSLGLDGRLRVQSRGNYLSPGRCHSQWNPLWPWLEQRREILTLRLGEDLILFGEWCYARHTVPYDKLPDWFLGFDVFDKNHDGFFSAERRNEWLHSCDLHSVPEIAHGIIRRDMLGVLLRKSTVGSVLAEGIYLRRDNSGWLESRAKIVSSEFKQQIEAHWTRRAVIPNRLYPSGVAMAASPR